jgi:hypothetical protein
MMSLRHQPLPLDQPLEPSTAGSTAGAINRWINEQERVHFGKEMRKSKLTENGFPRRLSRHVAVIVVHKSSLDQGP